MEGVWRSPSPAGNAPWKWFQTSAQAGNVRGSGSTPRRWPEMLRGSSSKPRRRLREAVELVSNLGAGRKCPLEAVPSLGARCTAPWKWFQTPFPDVAALWKWFQADFPAARRLGSRSTPISRLRHASRKIFGGAASLRTDIRSCHKYSHFLAVSIQAE